MASSEPMEPFPEVSAITTGSIVQRAWNVLRIAADAKPRCGTDATALVRRYPDGTILAMRARVSQAVRG